MQDGPSCSQFGCAGAHLVPSRSRAGQAAPGSHSHTACCSLRAESRRVMGRDSIRGYIQHQGMLPALGGCRSRKDRWMEVAPCTLAGANPQNSPFLPSFRSIQVRAESTAPPVPTATSCPTHLQHHQGFGPRQ